MRALAQLSTCRLRLRPGHALAWVRFLGGIAIVLHRPDCLKNWQFHFEDVTAHMENYNSSCSFLLLQWVLAQSCKDPISPRPFKPLPGLQLSLRLCPLFQKSNTIVLKLAVLNCSDLVKGQQR